MGNPAEWIHVIISGCIWAMIFGSLLLGLTAKSFSARRVWIWFVGSITCAGLSLAMVQAFGWRLLQGWLLQIFIMSLVGMCAFITFYLRSSRASHRNRDLDSYDGSAGLSTNDKAGFLRQAIEKAVNQTGYQKLRNQKRASFIKLAAMIFSSAATVLLGLKGVGSEQMFKNIAFVFSASVTLLTALEPFFNFRSFWVEHEIAQGRFLGLRADLEFYLAGLDSNHLDEGKLDTFHERYQKIWDDLNTVWAENRRREKT